MIETVRVWGLSLAVLTRAQAAEAVGDLIRAGRPSYVITAGTHYAMLTHRMPGLRPVNDRAAFLLADGCPLVWASRMLGTPLPERVAGSDLIFDLCERASRRGHRVFLLGARPGVADRAARRLVERYPGLVVAGVECPPFRDLTDAEHAAMLDRVRAARPDLLFVALGQPRGELWLAENVERLGVPVGVQVGASLDFVSGRVRRAPRLLQRLGLEWAFRMGLEPGRLAPRYARNGAFVARMVVADLIGRLARWRAEHPSPLPPRGGGPGWGGQGARSRLGRGVWWRGAPPTPTLPHEGGGGQT